MSTGKNNANTGFIVALVLLHPLGFFHALASKKLICSYYTMQCSSF